MNISWHARSLVIALCFAPSLFAASTKLSKFEGYSAVFVTRNSQQRLFTNSESRMDATLSEFKKQLAFRHHLLGGGDFSDEKRIMVGDRVCRRFYQRLRGKEIIGTRAALCFNSSGDLEGQQENICSGACLNASLVAVNIDRSHALDRVEQALRKLPGTNRGAVQSSKTVVDVVWIEMPSIEGLVPAYRVLMEFEEEFPPMTYLVYLDAQTGSLQGYERQVLYENATGNAYFQDRVVSKLSEKIVTRLDHKQRLSSVALGYSIFNADIAFATNADGEFFYPVDHLHFPEFQVAYALEQSISFLGRFGFRPLHMLQVVVNYGTDFENAFYRKRDHLMAIGDGGKNEFVAPDKDNMILSHENGHAVIDQMAEIKTLGDVGDGGAFHEGHSDFLACAQYNTVELARSVNPPNYLPLRKCNETLEYEQRSGEVHDDGRIWSGALWALREALMAQEGEIGKDIVNELSIQMLPRIHSTGWLGATLFTDTYRALLETERILFKRKYEPILLEVFSKRKFPRPVVQQMASSD